MTVQHVQWRVGAQAVLSSWGATCRVCTTAANPWHDGWDGTRPCAAIDVAAPAGSNVYVAGYNPSPVSQVTIWVGRLNDCVVTAMASDDKPDPKELRKPQPTYRYVRYLHMSTTYDPRRIPLNDWIRLVNVPPQTAFIYVVGRVGRSTGTHDECKWTSTGPHLHMDAPIQGLARNCGLQLGIAYGPSTPAFSFGA